VVAYSAAKLAVINYFCCCTINSQTNEVHSNYRSP